MDAFCILPGFWILKPHDNFIFNPAAAYLYFEKYKFNKISFQRIGFMFIVFIPTLVLFYSYLPIRAVQNPILNWGNPDTLAKILRHVEGNQYHVWLFSSTAAAEKQFLYFINNLPSEFLVNSFICIVGLDCFNFYCKKVFHIYKYPFPVYCFIRN